MFSKRLFTVLFIRVILIILTSFAFVTAMTRLHEEYYLSLIGIGALILYQIYQLVYFLNRTNRNLALFFSSVRNEDSVLRFSLDQQGSLFNSLNDSLDELNASIAKMRRQNTRQNLFLNNLVEHVGVGLISYTSNGNIDIFNHAAKDLLHLPRLNEIQDIAQHYPELHRCILQLQPDDQQLVKVLTEQSVLFLSVKLNTFVSEKETVNLLSLQNIRTELEQRELDSWQKLIRVLTHEISNSVSPINSLANTTTRYFIRENSGNIIRGDEVDDTLLRKTVENLVSIESTGKGLIDFVGNYRSLTAIPQPKFEKFVLGDFFDRIQTLLSEEAISNGILMEFKSLPYALELAADPGLLEKVMINIIINAFQALKNTEGGKVLVSAYKNIEGRIIVEVKDNGGGIPSDIIDDIFIPFYSTKEEGSGIGLSLSRQIMRLHSGTIRVSSVPDKETVFSLVF